MFNFLNGNDFKKRNLNERENIGDELKIESENINYIYFDYLVSK